MNFIVDIRSVSECTFPLQVSVATADIWTTPVLPPLLVQSMHMFWLIWRTSVDL